MLEELIEKKRMIEDNYAVEEKIHEKDSGVKVIQQKT